MKSNNKTVACVKFLIWVDNIAKSLTSEGSNGMFPVRVYRQPPLHVNIAWLSATLNRHDILVLWYFALLHTLKEVVKMFHLFLHGVLYFIHHAIQQITRRLCLLWSVVFVLLGTSSEEFNIYKTFHNRIVNSWKSLDSSVAYSAIHLSYH